MVQKKKGGKGAKGGKGRPAGLEQEDNSGKVKRINTLDGAPTSVCLYHVWNSSGCNRLNPHCKSASADICHPANRRGTGVLHAEKAKWQGCTFKECSYDPRSIGRGRCIFKHGTGDEQIAKHDKDKAGISSHQAVVNPPLDPGLATGQQPPAGGSPGGFWVSEADFEARVAQQITAQADRQAARDFSNLIEGFNRAGARVRDRLIKFLQQWQISHPGLLTTYEQVLPGPGVHDRQSDWSGSNGKPGQ